MRRDTHPRPSSVILTFNGIPAYTVDLAVCWAALMEMGGAGTTSFGKLADRAGTSRSTISAFFRGHPKSLRVGHRIIEALGLRFEAVARSIDPEPLQAAG